MRNNFKNNRNRNNDIAKDMLVAAFVAIINVLIKKL